MVLHIAVLLKNITHVGHVLHEFILQGNHSELGNVGILLDHVFEARELQV